ncbi:MAG TPA: FKBP-type peptidyl-prolyl cis-trans isomerase [Turneriella sp.]|nr:FKBP-type peptidyl-prolyl cis-trans isomerase [Turneriella sp.]HMY12224.1 FKBP-type peptidyl-prolyl cis-trans isomerase [Turneriella sp.]HNE20646.1 FKBP-type peptidyl-prolyl cis-trans isomerase [Turneriella sp.]HNJ66099.1 FKBP-type peptidyl-prolyl cis-trans isomerase [Turneriella sp.]HNL11257.1 FKBP-type peptidyl-prolyl cis-trans isomerase [Turneriella sp.]
MKQMNRAGLIALAITTTISFSACNRADVSSEKGKASYAIGYQVGRALKSQGAEVDPATIAAAIKDTMAGNELRMTEDEMRQAIQALQSRNQGGDPKVAAENAAKGKEYLDANKAKPGVQVTASGLQYKVISAGSGASPKATSTVKVHYRGTLIDGTEFDSSYKRGQPAEFGVSQVIRGWTEALQLMKKGAKYQLTIPSELAYGARNSGTIPANSVLNFEVELLDFK